MVELVREGEGETGRGSEGLTVLGVETIACVMMRRGSFVSISLQLDVLLRLVLSSEYNCNG